MTSILIVDDDPNSQRVLSYTLRKNGYDARIAANGENALSLLGESASDLVIVDMAMPVMDGLTLLRHMRADERLRGVPVIILTGSGDDYDRLQAEQAGIQGFLSKPSSSKTVLEVVRHALGQE
ncbi:MAG: response regulator [Chloroflexi bacterium]|nr:response regulator [Chloroflexota bacterium]